MKKLKNELEVDSIGDGRTLTKDEEKAISDFLRAAREGHKKENVLKKVSSISKKVSA